MTVRDYVLIIDFGSSGLKTHIVNSSGNVLAESKGKWKVIVDPDYPFIVEYDAQFMEKLLFTLIKDVIKASKIDANNIKAISCVAQRIGTIFLDKNNKEIYAGPNVDSRGILVDFPIDEDMVKRIYEISGHTPPFIFSPMRFLWFKENKPIIAQKISKILSTHDWIIYKLTGNTVTEPSIASDMLIFDINKRKWSEELLDFFNINLEQLSEVKNAGDFAGEIKTEVAKQLGLPRNMSVYVGGGDTHFGLLAAGLIKEQHYGCVAGYTSPVMGILDKPLIDEDMKVWTGCYILSNTWSLESNVGVSGGLVDWFIKSFLNSRSKDLYRYFEKLVESSEPGAKGVRIKVGSMIMNAKNMAEQKITGLILLPSPVLPFIKPARIEDFARSILETIAFAVKANLKQLIETTNIKLECFGLTGGLTRFKIFPKILSSVLGTKIQVSREYNGSVLACAAMTFNSLQVYSSLEKAIKNMIKLYNVEPDSKNIQIYNEFFLDWLNMYE